MKLEKGQQLADAARRRPHAIQRPHVAIVDGAERPGEAVEAGSEELGTFGHASR